MKGLLKIHEKSHQYLYTFALGALIFNGYYWVMKRLPSVGDVPACTIGGAVTPENLFFSGVLSILTALMIAGFIRLYSLRKTVKKKGLTGSIASLGFIVGFFTVFCALCTIPVISFFGLAIGLGFFTTYNLFFKILSIVLMLISLALLDSQLSNACQICKQSYTSSKKS